MTAPSTERVALRVLLARASVEMDIYARARTLESAGGLPKWSLSGNPMGFIREGPMQFPEAHSDWFSSRNQGMSLAIEKGAMSVLKGYGDKVPIIGDMTANEVVQNMLSGLDPQGKETTDVFGYLGKKKGEDILSGSTKPGKFLTTLFGWAKDKAVDTIRTMATKKRQREKEHPNLINVDDPETQNVGKDDDIGAIIQKLLMSPLGDKFRKWMYKSIRQWGSEAQQAVMEGYFDFLARNHREPRNKELALAAESYLGKTITPQMAGRHRDRTWNMLVGAIQKNQKLLAELSDFAEIARLRLAKDKKASASRVASRFLALHRGS